MNRELAVWHWHEELQLVSVRVERRERKWLEVWCRSREGEPRLVTLIPPELCCFALRVPQAEKFAFSLRRGDQTIDECEFDASLGSSDSSILQMGWAKSRLVGHSSSSRQEMRVAGDENQSNGEGGLPPGVEEVRSPRDSDSTVRRQGAALVAHGDAVSGGRVEVRFSCAKNSVSSGSFVRAKVSFSKPGSARPPVFFSVRPIGPELNNDSPARLRVSIGADDWPAEKTQDFVDVQPMEIVFVEAAPDVDLKCFLIDESGPEKPLDSAAVKFVISSIKPTDSPPPNGALPVDLPPIVEIVSQTGVAFDALDTEVQAAVVDRPLVAAALVQRDLHGVLQENDAGRLLSLPFDVIDAYCEACLLPQQTWKPEGGGALPRLADFLADPGLVTAFHYRAHISGENWSWSTWDGRFTADTLLLPLRLVELDATVRSCLSQAGWQEQRFWWLCCLRDVSPDDVAQVRCGFRISVDPNDIPAAAKMLADVGNAWPREGIAGLFCEQSTAHKFAEKIDQHYRGFAEQGSSFRTLKLWSRLLHDLRVMVADSLARTAAVTGLDANVAARFRELARQWRASERVDWGLLNDPEAGDCGGGNVDVGELAAAMPATRWEARHVCELQTRKDDAAAVMLAAVNWLAELPDRYPVADWSEKDIPPADTDQRLHTVSESITQLVDITPVYDKQTVRRAFAAVPDWEHEFMGQLRNLNERLQRVGQAVSQAEVAGLPVDLETVSAQIAAFSEDKSGWSGLWLERLWRRDRDVLRRKAAEKLELLALNDADDRLQRNASDLLGDYLSLHTYLEDAGEKLDEWKMRIEQLPGAVRALVGGAEGVSEQTLAARLLDREEAVMQELESEIDELAAQQRQAEQFKAQFQSLETGH